MMAGADPFAEIKKAVPSREEMAVLSKNQATRTTKAEKRQPFIMMPWLWYERLDGATGRTHRVALMLLHLHWKSKGQPIKLTNVQLRMLGVSRQSKWRALHDLQGRGLITVEHRPNRSPLVRLLSRKVSHA